MKRIFLTILAFLLTSPAFGSWGALGSLGTGLDEDGLTTITLTTTAALEAGNIGVCIVAADNDGNGISDDYTTATDSAGNTWTVYAQNEADPGAANAGAAVAIIAVKAGLELALGGTITVTAPDGPTKAAITCREFSVTATFVISQEGATGAEDSTGDAGLLTVGSLANREHLFVRGIAAETETTTTDMTLTTSYARFDENGTTNGAEAANMTVFGEYYILTATTSTSNPTLPDTTNDNTSVMIALNEDAPAEGQAIVVD